MARINGMLRLLLAVAAAIGGLQVADAASLKLLPAPVGTTERQLSDMLSGFGLAGYDPVSYLLDPSPRAGLAAHEVLHAGVAWRFANEANRAAFLREPEAFMPRIGSYDTAAAAAGRLAQADPAIFAISGARIYLFRRTADRDRFLREGSGFAEAEQNWDHLRLELARR